MQASYILETLSSYPEALHELSKALMPSLMKNLTALAQKRQEAESDEASNGEGDFNEEEGNNSSGANNGSNVNNRNEANTGNGANNGNKANNGNEAINTGNEAINTGNEVNYYARANDGAGAFQYRACGNEASHSQ